MGLKDKIILDYQTCFLLSLTHFTLNWLNDIKCRLVSFHHKKLISYIRRLKRNNTGYTCQYLKSDFSDHMYIIVVYEEKEKERLNIRFFFLFFL